MVTYQGTRDGDPLYSEGYGGTSEVFGTFTPKTHIWSVCRNGPDAGPFINDGRTLNLDKYKVCSGLFCFLFLRVCVYRGVI